MNIRFKRILLKLSGESLSGEAGYGIDKKAINYMVGEVVSILSDTDITVGIVVGGGNIFRGLSGTGKGIDRITGDYMGMLSTVINAMALKSVFSNNNIDCKIITSFEISKIGEAYHQDVVDNYLDNNKVVIFAGGTGNPFFTTDTTAALRANEIKADCLIKATRVNGIFNKDPEKHNNASKISNISYIDVLTKKLKVMDSTAVSLCMDNEIPILVLDVMKSGNLRRNVSGDITGSIIN